MADIWDIWLADRFKTTPWDVRANLTHYDKVRVDAMQAGAALYVKEQTEKREDDQNYSRGDSIRQKMMRGEI